MSGRPRQGMRERWLPYACACPEIDDGTRSLLLILWNLMGPTGRVSVPRADVAELLAVTENTISKRIRRAVQAGLLSKLGGGYEGRAAEYEAILPAGRGWTTGQPLGPTSAPALATRIGRERLPSQATHTRARDLRNREPTTATAGGQRPSTDVLPLAAEIIHGRPSESRAPQAASLRDGASATLDTDGRPSKTAAVRSTTSPSGHEPAPDAGASPARGFLVGAAVGEAEPAPARGDQPRTDRARPPVSGPGHAGSGGRLSDVEPTINEPEEVTMSESGAAPHAEPQHLERSTNRDQERQERRRRQREQDIQRLQRRYGPVHVGQRR